jgi:S1-C subfamily serine protease
LTSLDWIILGFTLFMGLWGFAQGLIVGALSLAGFVGGAFLGARVGPLLLSEGSRSPYAPLFALGLGATLGFALASGLEIVGFRLRRRMGQALGVADGIGGALLLACLGLAFAWVLGSVALQTPGARELRPDIQRSRILRALNSTLPPSGPLLKALARFDPFPRINGPRADVPAPNSRIARDPQVRAVARSVVRVLGTACGLGVQGSGWVAADGIVVTNAHVVAGEDDTTVQVGGSGPSYDANAIHFDPGNDLAVLSVPGVSGVRALPLATQTRPGTSAAILGFPGDGPYDVEPGRLGPTTTVLSQDAYGRGPIRRRITSLRGLVRSGNSGGPMVDGRGGVVTTIFAATVGESERSGFGVPDSVVAEALRSSRGAEVDTGACVH